MAMFVGMMLDLNDAVAAKQPRTNPERRYGSRVR